MNMKVKELIKELNKLVKEGEGETDVILSSDEEGNNFGEVGDGFGFYKIDDRNVIAIYPESYIDGFDVEYRGVDC